MPEDTPRNTRTAPAGVRMPTLDVQPMMAANQAGMRAIAEAGGHLASQMTRMNGEIADFVGRRLEHDRETMTALSTCTTLSETFSIYTDYVQRMMRDYTEEMGTLANLYAETARETMDDMQAGMRESVSSTTRDRGDA